MKNEKEVIEHIKKCYTYDAATGEIRNRKGQVVKGSDRGGYRRKSFRIGKHYHAIDLHCMAWALVYGRFPRHIDHIDGNRHNNRIENLREVSDSENQLNTLHDWIPNGDTGVPGVYNVKRGYQTRIHGKKCHFADANMAFYHATMCGKIYI